MDLLTGKKILICGKGGCGKSVFTSISAKILNSKGYRVSLLDVDPSNADGLSRLCLGMKNGPRPLVDLVKSIGHYGDDGIPFGGKPGELDFKLSRIPARYYMRHENIVLFQVGKVPFQHLSHGELAYIMKYFRLNDSIMLIDNESGIEYFDTVGEEIADIVLILVSPEYESIRLAERINKICRERKVDNVWVILSNIRSENVASELKDQLVRRDLPVIGVVYHDDEIRRAVMAGEMIPYCKAFNQVSKIIRITGTRALTQVFST